MAESLVEFKSVVKKFGDFTAVETMISPLMKVSSSLLWDLGCGKTTTL